MNKLQARAQAFADRAIPDSINYVRGSIAENLITNYARTGNVDLSPEHVELLSICLMETKFAADHRIGDEGEYFRENYQILSQIIAEHR